jgi:hypothetical protein
MLLAAAKHIRYNHLATPKKHFAKNLSKIACQAPKRLNNMIQNGLELA